MVHFFVQCGGAHRADVAAYAAAVDLAAALDLVLNFVAVTVSMIALGNEVLV